jgi:hypothetical protein
VVGHRGHDRGRAMYEIGSRRAIFAPAYVGLERGQVISAG